MSQKWDEVTIASPNLVEFFTMRQQGGGDLGFIRVSTEINIRIWFEIRNTMYEIVHYPYISQTMRRF